jgi:hypothetical protein
MSLVAPPRAVASFERIDLVDQLRFRLAKAPLTDSGWIGHVPLLANRLYLRGFLAEEDATTPWRNKPIRAGLALALTDVQYHPQCPLWVNYGLNPAYPFTSAVVGEADIHQGDSIIHSATFDHLRVSTCPLTAIPTAFFWPTKTTSFLPLVMPV